MASATTVNSEMKPELELPGFRFHPTEEELLEFYLKSVVLGKRLRFDIIEFLNIYRHDPWDLPGTYTHAHALFLSLVSEFYNLVNGDRRCNELMGVV